MAERDMASRPLSPHLQIWRFTVTMAASITHRAAGVILYGGALLFGLWLIGLAFNEALFGLVSGLLQSPLGIVIVAGYIWALSFHLMNGLRHLYWDSGRGLAPKTATKTAWAVYIASLALTVLIVWAGYAAKGGA